MKTIKKRVCDWTCGFEECYSVSKIKLTLGDDLINQISIAWEYLSDKRNQSIRINCNLDEIHFNSNDDDFNRKVYSIFIQVYRDRTIIIECKDHCCSICYSSIITETELK
jgi:hypothetical protein